jgi:hypothetical protein
MAVKHGLDNYNYTYANKVTRNMFFHDLSKEFN